MYKNQKPPSSHPADTISHLHTEEKLIDCPPLVKEIVSCLEEHKGQDIYPLNVKQICHFTDWMVFCTGSSKRHTKSLANYLCEDQKKRTNTIFSTEGIDVGEWVIVDLVDAVVHIMQPQARELYALEKLWHSDPAD